MRVHAILLHSLVDIFPLTNMVCYYITSLPRGAQQTAADDFMDPPQRNRATGRRKEGDEVTVHTPAPSPPDFCYWLAPISFVVVCHELNFHDIAKHGNS